MARIDKAEHAKILQAVEVERRKVAEVAAEYGCTPANIYALLGKLRRATDKGVDGIPSPGTSPAVGSNTPAASRAERDALGHEDTLLAPDLFGAAAGVIQERPGSPANTKTL